MFKGKNHRYHTQVHYKDLDMFSVVYHPKYFEFADCGRNQAFADFGYPVQDQLKDKVGFTVAGIQDVNFYQPLFIEEKITVFTELVEVGKKSCKVDHWITLGHDTTEINLNNKFEKAIFKSTYSLVFVSIKEIGEFPLNRGSVKNMKTLEFSDKVKSCLNF